ncbi:MULTISPECIES: hypothetical protein [Streptomyces]|uniref:hypothetical protein n=1 Tax=Streptomyces TaxID=1883 RepID=UPI00136E45E5|nr:hypothetical protein [Streptomyces sp. SID2888]MYV49076.1 hypothetical protein [Streptomyces sp. SID2888]
MHANGYRTVLVPAVNSRDVHALGLGLDMIGVGHVREAIEFLEPSGRRRGATAAPEQIRANGNGLALLAWVLRELFLAATAVSVHVPDRDLVAVLGDGITLWDLGGPVLRSRPGCPSTPT